MGQHKYNPTASAAKKGSLPPKPEKMTKAELEHEIMKAFTEKYPGMASFIMTLDTICRY